MVIVTGTKRSGTSMWMQILIGAGFPAFGDAFPMAWGDSPLRRANEDGFYESILRSGIYFATNPHPITGTYLFPEQVERHAIKIFIPGLVRTERAFIGRVIATMREWREYEASVHRLYALEAESDPLGKPRPHMTPALEWWWENYLLIRDVSLRGYAVHLQSYDGLLADPERVITDTLQWIGHGDAKGACARVRRQHRHFERPASTSVEPQIAAVFDELYSRVHERSGLSAAFVRKLNETNDALKPLIDEERRRVFREIQKIHSERQDGVVDTALLLDNFQEPADEEG